MMRADNKPMIEGKPPSHISWPDAVILAGAVLGILIGVSFLSFRAAIAVAVAMLVFVVYKLVTTQT